MKRDTCKRNQDASNELQHDRGRQREAQRCEQEIVEPGETGSLHTLGQATRASKRLRSNRSRAGSA